MLNKLTKQKLLFIFMFLMSMGLLFDTYDKINKFGWDYEYSIMINNELIKVYSFNGESALSFCLIYLMFTTLCFSVLIDLKKRND